jgi:hypothetical protein
MEAGEHFEGKDELTKLGLDARKVGTLLHRIALHGLTRTYRLVMEGLGSPIPKDVYGRLPSAVAPVALRGEFEAIETSFSQVGDNQ